MGIHVFAHMRTYVHVRTCMWRLKVDAGSHPHLLSHLIHWGRGLSIKQVLNSVTSLTSQLALGTSISAFEARITGCPPFPLTFVWISGDMHSSPYALYTNQLWSLSYFSSYYITYLWGVLKSTSLQTSLLSLKLHLELGDGMGLRVHCACELRRPVKHPGWKLWHQEVLSLSYPCCLATSWFWPNHWTPLSFHFIIYAIGTQIVTLWWDYLRIK